MALSEAGGREAFRWHADTISTEHTTTAALARVDLGPVLREVRHEPYRNDASGRESGYSS
jgi:hypothetical protein